MNLPKRKILVIDDDQEICRTLEDLLTHNGFEVQTASDGYAGVAAAVAFNPELIFLDLDMPAGGGFSVVERLRQNERFKRIPILIITGNRSELMERRALDAGLVYIRKPIEMKGLIERVNTALSPE